MNDKKINLAFIGLVGYALTASISITLSQISLCLAFLGLLQDWRSADSKDFLQMPFLPAYVCLAIAAVLSLPFAVDMQRALIEMKKFLIILVFWVGYASKLTWKQRYLVLGSLIASASIVAIMTVIHQFVRIDNTGRAHGFFSLPLTFGESQMLHFLLAVAWLMFAKSSRQHRNAILVATICLALGVAVSFTRGVFIGLGLGLVVMFRNRPPLIIAALTILTVIMAVGLIMTRHLTDRAAVLSIDPNQPDGLQNIRLRIWSVGLNIFNSSPVFGVGMNNVKPHYQDRATSVEHACRYVYGHLHNSFLQYLVMTGLCGFLAFVWFCIDMGRFALELPKRFNGSDAYVSGNSHSDSSALAQAALPIWVAFLGSGLTEYAYGDEEVAMLAFFILGFLAAPYHRSYNHRSEDSVFA